MNCTVTNGPVLYAAVSLGGDHIGGVGVSEGQALLEYAVREILGVASDDVYEPLQQYPRESPEVVQLSGTLDGILAALGGRYASPDHARAIVDGGRASFVDALPPLTPVAAARVMKECPAMTRRPHSLAGSAASVLLSLADGWGAHVLGR